MKSDILVPAHSHPDGRAIKPTLVLFSVHSPKHLGLELRHFSLLVGAQTLGP